MKRRLLLYLIPFLFTAFFLVLQLIDPQMISEQLESKTYDLRLRLRNALMRQPASKDIFIVAIDDKSIEEIGRWPWSRNVMAALIKNISSAGPKAIGVDIMFTEREGPLPDEKLARTIKEAGNVVLATAFDVPVGKKAVPPREPAPDFLWDAAFMEVRSQKGLEWKKFAFKAERVMPSIPEISEAGVLGHVYTQPDLDGVQRWEILSLLYGDDSYPQFALQIARIAQGVEMKSLVLYGGSGIGLGNTFISTDLHGRAGINYRGKEHSFEYISAADVVNGRIPSDTLRNKIVLVGTSALATYDQKVTPLSANVPGVEKNATVVENILLNKFIVKSPGVMELVVILLTGIFLGFSLPRLKAVSSALLAAGFIFFYILACCYLLIFHSLWVNLLYPVTNMFGIFVTLTVMKFFHEEKKSKEIRQIFSSYVSPKIVKELIDNPDKVTLSGQRREVTVLFSDIIGFTSLSEKLQPEQVVSLLNEYFQDMAHIIFKWDGTLDKFVGDEIMALWGAPIEQPDHSELALRCALEMSERLTKLQEEWRSRGSDILDVGIGINTGEVLIGNIGAPGRKMDYTAIGDNVTLLRGSRNLPASTG
jgi:adenylate cyclase